MKRKISNVFPSPFSYFLESKMFSFKVYGWLLSRNVLFYVETQQIWLFSPLSVPRTYSLCFDLGNSHVTPLGLLRVSFLWLFEIYYFSMSLVCLWLNWYTTKTQSYQKLGENSATSFSFKIIPDSIMSSKLISVMAAEGKTQQIEKKCFSGVYMFCVARN